MKYKTHIKITKRTDEGIYYLVEGIEYPNLITSGSTYNEAIEMAIDAWSLLCVVYEDKGTNIKKSNEYLNEIKFIQEATTSNDKFYIKGVMIEEIESEDVNEYRKFCSKPRKNKEDNMSIFSDSDIELMEKINEFNDSYNIDWIKNHKEFIGFATINWTKYMFVVKKRVVEVQDMQASHEIVTYRITIYDLTTDKKYELMETPVYCKLGHGLIKELYENIIEKHMYRRIKTKTSDEFLSENKLSEVKPLCPYRK